MKTPYDPVVRFGTREVDALRDALRRETARIVGLAHDAAALAQRVHDECTLADRDELLPIDQWLRARKRQAERIAQTRAEAEAGLALMRDRAMGAYGRLRAAESVADAYIKQARVSQDRKAQAEADDLGTARRLLRLRHRQRRRAETTGRAS